MRVALVVEKLAPARGGVERACFELARELAGRGLELTVLCRHAEGAPPPGVRVERVPAPAAWQPLRISLFSRRAGRATRGRFDVVHAFARTRWQDVYRAGGGCHAAYLEALYRAPRLARLSPRHRAILSIEEAVFADARQVIQCISRRDADEIARRYGVSRDRLVTIYNGVDLSRFTPMGREPRGEAMRRELGVEGPVALFAGNEFHRKGLDRAVRGLASAGVPATLLVAGGGDPRPAHALAQRLGVGGRVRFLGRRDDVDRLLDASDLFVLPTRYDAFSVAILEALAAGVPVATTPAAGAAELVAHALNGFVLEDDFAPAFAALARPDALAAMGRAARETAASYTFKRHADEVLGLYERLRA